MYDLGIINGRVYTDGGFIRTNVYVTDGKIETEVISAAGTEYPGTEKAPGGGA